MGFGSFKTDAEVAEKFNLIIREGFFIETLPFNIPENKRHEIKELLDDPLAFVSEYAICEDIIKPILRVLDKAYKEFRVWSHIIYDVDASVNLSGTPDFLIARPKKVGIGNLIDVPPLCVIEAKKRDWDNAWGKHWRNLMPHQYKGRLFVMRLLLTVSNGNLVNILKPLYYF